MYFMSVTYEFLEAERDTGLTFNQEDRNKGLVSDRECNKYLRWILTLVMQATCSGKSWQGVGQEISETRVYVVWY